MKITKKTLIAEAKKIAIESNISLIAALTAMQGAANMMGNMEVLEMLCEIKSEEVDKMFQ